MRWLARARLAHYAERFFFLFYPADRSRSYLPVLSPLLVGQPVKMVTKNDHHAGSRWNVWRWTDVADAAGCGEDRRRASCLTIVYFFRHSEEPGRMWLASFAPTMTTTAGAQEHFKEPGSGKSQTGRRRLSSRTHSGGCLNSFIRISVLCTSCWGLLRCCCSVALHVQIQTSGIISFWIDNNGLRRPRSWFAIGLSVERGFRGTVVTRMQNS